MRESEGLRWYLLFAEWLPWTLIILIFGVVGLTRGEGYGIPVTAVGALGVAAAVWWVWRDWRKDVDAAERRLQRSRDRRARRMERRAARRGHPHDA